MTCRFGPWPVLALLLSALLHAAPARADRDEAGAQICERAIQAGAGRERVPEGVLHAISLTETGRAKNGRLRPWPWAINREGKGYWFANRDEALAFARDSVAAGRTSFDVGCFQINYFWHGRNFPSLESMFDPDTGADYAARFLRSLYAERGDWSAAAGAYHSQTPDRASVYRARFDRILAGLDGTPLMLAASQPEAPQTVSPPRRSRTRLAGPKIINLKPAATRAATEAGLRQRPAATSAIRAVGQMPQTAELTL